MKLDYRKRFYNKYVSQQVLPHGAGQTITDYEIWAKGAERRFAGWYPADRSAPVLDVGCGAGNFLFSLQHLGYRDLTGVDLSPEQAALARQWCPEARIIEGNVFDVLQTYSNHFALISGLDVIEHFRKDEVLPFLELVYRALRPGGRLILQTPNAASPWVGSVAYSDFTHEWFYSPRGLERILGMAGFSGYECRESGPFAHGFRSGVRSFLWCIVRGGLRLYDLIETGGDNGGVYTRVFVATAVKGDK
ncbi:MAG: class I SAM-dependent methyltransferase [Chloroflexota bacterium]|nr:class I SAM-dependent methyltransferase [Chloroflexota bacterium]MBI5703908.1 class I SAM-dependent methyltransferase [Chloroflexota bacterium]